MFVGEDQKNIHKKVSMIKAISENFCEIAV